MAASGQAKTASENSEIQKWRGIKVLEGQCRSVVIQRNHYGAVRALHPGPDRGMRRFADPRVASRFKSYPPALRARLMALRELVFDTAAATAGVGRLTETLKWAQPSYLTGQTGSGTTVRIDRLKTDDGYAIYFHCQSGLVGQFRDLYPDTFTYEGQRAMHFAIGDRLPVRELRHCIALTLTHHLRKQVKRGG